MNSLTQRFFEEMKGNADLASTDIPSQAFLDTQAEILEYVEQQSLRVSFPILSRYNNPMGITLGGYLPVFFDLTMGPLSYLLCKMPLVSLDLNTQFYRPLFPKDERLIVLAKKIEESKNYLILEASAYNLKQKLIATATSRLQKVYA